MTDDAGLYDLWVLGPNGFHRHFKGDLNRLRADGAPVPEIRVGYDTRRGDIYLQMRNDGRRDCRFTVQSQPGLPAARRPPAARTAATIATTSEAAIGATATADHDHDHGHESRGSWSVRVKGGDDTSMRWSLDASGSGTTSS